TRFSRDWSSDVCSSDLEEDEAVLRVSALEDLVGDAGQRPGDLRGTEHGYDRAERHLACSFPASQDGSLKDGQIAAHASGAAPPRSEERRVGEGGRSRRT